MRLAADSKILSDNICKRKNDNVKQHDITYIELLKEVETAIDYAISHKAYQVEMSYLTDYVINELFKHGYRIFRTISKSYVIQWS